MIRSNNLAGEKEDIKYSLSNKPANNDIFGSDIKFKPQDENILGAIDHTENEASTPPISDNNPTEKHEPKIDFKTCPKCGYINLSNDNSCSFCETNLTTLTKCPDCHYEISYEKTHCPYCGYDLSYYVLNAKFAISQYNKLVTTLIVALIVLIPLILEIDKSISYSLMIVATILAAYALPVVICRLINKNPFSEKRGKGIAFIFTVLSTIVFLIALDYIKELDHFTVGATVPSFLGYVNYLILTSKKQKTQITAESKPTYNKRMIIIICVAVVSIVSVISIIMFNGGKEREANSSISIVSKTDNVIAGSEAHITVKGKPNTQYSISVYYDSGESTADGLEEKYSDDDGYVSWKWMTSPSTNDGEHKIVISDGQGKLTTYFYTLQDDYIEADDSAYTDDSVYVIE